MAKSLVAKNWSPTPRGRVYARTHGINEPLLAEQTSRFIEHHRKKGNKYEDWDMAWQTWCRNYAKYNPQLKESSESIQYVYAGRRHPEEIYPLPEGSPFKRKLGPNHPERSRYDDWLKRAMDAIPPDLAPHEAAERVQYLMQKNGQKNGGKPTN